MEVEEQMAQAEGVLYNVICLNGYPVLYHEPHFSPSERGAQTQWWIDHLQTVHEKYPDKPILVAEFGSMAIRGLRGNLYGEDAQAAIIEAQYAGMHAPYVCGACIWCYSDHAWPRGRTSLFGVVSRDRSYRKMAYQTVRELFSSSSPGEQAGA